MLARTRIAGLLCACLIAAGAAQAAEPPPVADTSAYYVIGLVPGEPSLVVSPGDLKKGLFEIGDTAVLPQTATGGFLVGKIDGSGRVAITSIGFVNPPSENWGLELWLSAIMKDKRSFVPCGDQSTVFFEPVAGKVLYIGTLTYGVSTVPGDYGRIMVAVANDLDSARDYLNARHPELAARLEQGSYQFRSIDRVCPKAWYERR